MSLPLTFYSSEIDPTWNDKEFYFPFRQKDPACSQVIYILLMTTLVLICSSWRAEVELEPFLNWNHSIDSSFCFQWQACRYIEATKATLLALSVPTFDCDCHWCLGICAGDSNLKSWYRISPTWLCRFQQCLQDCWFAIQPVLIRAYLFFHASKTFYKRPCIH